MNNTPELSILILIKNAADVLPRTLNALSGMGEIVVLDDHSTDESVLIAESYGAKIITTSSEGFSSKRNQLLHEARYNWICFVDADEVITPALKAEIIEVVHANKPAAFTIRRRNYFLGKEMYTDAIERLFHRSILTGYEGEIHEHPQLKSGTDVKTLHHPLLHFTHRSISSMLAKTNEWSEVEAQLRLDTHHPPMAWWRLIRMATTTFISNYFGKQLYRYGREGLFEAYFQMIDKLIVYTKLWEKQQKTKKVITDSYFT